MSSLARRYARALLELAKEQEVVADFGANLNALSQAVQESPQILEGLGDDSLPIAERLAAMTSVADHLKLHSHLKNFLLLLIEKNRILLLHEIAIEYQRLSDELLGIVRVSVVMTEKPDAATLERINRILEFKLKKKVISRGAARPEVVGGVILKIDHTIYDGSVRRELERMRDVLMKG